MNEFLFERVVNLRAQPANRHIDNIGIAVEVHVPHLRRNNRPGENLASLLRQKHKQCELLRAQIYSPPRPSNTMLGNVNFEVSDIHRVGIP